VNGNSPAAAAARRPPICSFYLTVLGIFWFFFGFFSLLCLIQKHRVTTGSSNPLDREFHRHKFLLLLPAQEVKEMWKITVTHTQRRLRSSVGPESVGAGMLCPTCRRRVLTFTVRQAAELLGADEQAVLGLAQNGRLHCIPLATGSFLICRDSLFLTS
jgi:hypothetical protein